MVHGTLWDALVEVLAIHRLLSQTLLRYYMFNHNLIFIEIRYQYYGTWYAMRCSGRICVGYTYAAISDTVEILHV